MIIESKFTHLHDTSTRQDPACINQCINRVRTKASFISFMPQHLSAWGIQGPEVLECSLNPL